MHFSQSLSLTIFNSKVYIVVNQTLYGPILKFAMLNWRDRTTLAPSHEPCRAASLRALHHSTPPSHSSFSTAQARPHSAPLAPLHDPTTARPLDSIKSTTESTMGKVGSSSQSS
jgi:hypothetical protein